MRKFFTLFFLLVISFINPVLSQTDITIGTGTTGNTGTTYPVPLQDYFEGSRMQFLYRASELTSAGMGPGIISAIKWNVTNLDGAGVIEQMSVTIGTTPVNSLSTSSWDPINNAISTPQTDYTPVTGINTIMLPTPFFWDGVSNIIVEVCNGEPGNSSGTWWTSNPIIPWTTGLGFNGSHSYRADNLGNLCGTSTTTNTGTQTTRPNIIFNWTPAMACSGAPDAGNAVSTTTVLLCAGTQFTLSLSNATVASGLSYQWQSSTDDVNFTNITGATSAFYTTTQTGASVYYRAIVTCAGQSSNSTSVNVVNSSSPIFTTLPYIESFENTWASGCNTRELPTVNWASNPVTGNNSWRRNDDGGSASWTNITTGAYTPSGSDGNYSARFHSDIATNGSIGVLDLYFNANTAASAKRLRFDYINTAGNDSLVVYLSTDGGASFARLDSFRTTAGWETKTNVFNTTSATSILRFSGTADAGTSDIGIDNLILSTFADCTGTPNGGSTSTNRTNVCVGDVFTLTFTGGTDGNGIIYQWQASTDGGTTWNDIAGANGYTYTGTQVQTTIYRVLVTCTFSSISTPSATVQVNSPDPVVGNYTIDNSNPTNIPARTFNNFNDAYDFIKCGIAGPTVFNVLAGTGQYTEQLIMDAVPGTSATNTVTFKGDGTAAIGFSSTNSTNRAVIKLRAADYIIFDSLIINANTGTYGYGVQLVNISGGDGADFNVVRNCTINSSTTVNNTNFAGIVVSGSDTDPVGVGSNVVADGNIFENNIITGGQYGITLTATFAGGANGNNIIRGNEIKDFYLNGVHVVGSYGTIVDGNDISRPTRTPVGDFNGILFTTQKTTLATVSNNRIHNPFGGAPTASGAFVGIGWVNAAGTAGTGENFVYNNLIYNPNGNGAWSGLLNTASGFVYYMHNTIDLHDPTSTSNALTRGLNITSASGGLFFFNNMVNISRGGNGQKHAIYLSGGLLAGSDNNNYYVSPLSGNNYTGFYTTNRRSLSDWQAATNGDLNSHAINPAFDRTGDDRIPGNAGVDNRGIYVGIDDDINQPGVRSMMNPDIGAHEFTAPACTVPPVNGVVTISPNTICQNNPVNFSVDIGAYGSSQTFQWQTATTETGTYTDFGNALTTPDTTIISDTTLWFRVAATCSGVTTYSDPVQLTVYPALPAGTYTINSANPRTYFGPGTGTNFQTFNEAKDAMNCGILGTVVFEVDPTSGPYNEQLILDSIYGTSPTSTVTFMGNGRTIRYNSLSSTERAVIKLRGADYVTFDSLVIDATGGPNGSFGYGVQLINNADTNTFRNCVITTPISTLTNFAGIVINATDAGLISNGNNWCDGNTFIGNTIDGGYYGATVVGSNSAANYINDNSFINNTFTNFFSAGMHVSGTNNTLIEGNDFSRPLVNANIATVSGIYLVSAPSLNLKITRNKFHNFFASNPVATSAFYAVYHNNVKATAGSENEVSNNLIYNIEHNGTLYAFYNTAADNVRYYHNTISLDNSASTATGPTAGFYQNSVAQGVDFKNNMITITRGGIGPKYGIYLAASTSDVQSDYNNIFINATGTNNFFGFSGGGRITRADWETATGKDVNSLEINPLYRDSANLDYRPAITPLNDKGTFVNVPEDILLVARPMVPNGINFPDIGAFEFNPPVCDNPPVAGLASVTPNTGICLETPISLDITGHSNIGSLTFQWFSSADNVNWTPLSGILYGPQYDTLATTNTYYRAAVTCEGVTTNTNVVQVTLGDILPAGTYTISANPTDYPTGTNFQGFQAAVDAMQCGIGGKIVFNVAAGTYTEQIRIGNIRGVAPDRTVTFQAANGNPASVNLTFASTSLADNYTLKLDSTKYFIFKELTISATDPVFGRAVELATVASFDSILNCVINAPATSSPNPNITGIYAGAFRGTQNVIKGNTINNGSYGIFFVGAGLAANLTEDHIIDSNTVNGFYNYGIYTSFHKRIRVTRNRVNAAMPIAGAAYSIYLNDCDSSFVLEGNRVTIDNTTTNVYGIYVNNSDSSETARSIINGNIINATGTNTGSLYGMYLNNSVGHSATNNVISLNNTGPISWGLWTNSNAGIYWNNTVRLTSTSPANGYAAYFNNSAAVGMNIRNNIFSNEGGGRAMFVNNTSQSGASDYNMLYSTGAVLVQRGSPAAAFNSLNTYTAGTGWDKWSIVYQPALTNNDLQPDLNNPDVWAMHGRGEQIPGNNQDINGNFRPTTLIEGVPDLGAYEFLPAAEPTALTATPAVPAPNTLQTFMYGTDTVMKVTWGATAPASVVGRRYSGVVPANLAGRDSMYFYTKLESPDGGTYPYHMEVFYLDPWQGSIPDQNQIGLGKTTSSLVNWIVGFSSRTDVRNKVIRQTDLDFFDKFTGLVNPYAPPVLPDKDSSNQGRRFWVAYPRNQLNAGSSQQMVLYLSATEAANVQVRINGTSWVRNYTVPANTVTVTEYLPKAGADMAYLPNPGLSERGISIESDVPIVAYAHVIGSTSSGASMLMPVGVWGYEYRTLGITQSWGSGGFSYFYVIADNDNTVVEITTPAGIALQNAGMTPGTPFVVTLNKGEVYQVLASGTTTELSGSLIKSIPNSQGRCYPIASFSGTSRTYIDCPTSGGGGGDFIMQQNFPSTAWGKRYLTAPSSASTAANNLQLNVYRVAVKDPTTVVRRNGTIMTGLQNNFYYQFTSNTADFIEADKPIMVAQYLTGACTGVGDPEMIYLSPIEQGIDQIGFYRNNEEAITVNYLTLIVPTNGMGSLQILDGGTPVTPDHTYAHPQNALTGNNYTVVVKRWNSAKQQVIVKSDSAFTAITYGLGSVESYGYNAGTMVRTLTPLALLNNTLNPSGNPTEFTCVGSPFQITALIPLQPTSLFWQFSNVPGLSPSADTTMVNPVATDTIEINGKIYYAFNTGIDFTLDAPGLYTVPITFAHPDIESCDKTQQDVIYIQVLPSPRTNFAINFGGCAGDQAQIVGDAQTENGIPINNWSWTFHDGTTATGQNTSYTYNTPGNYDIRLTTITPDGCIGDSTNTVIVNPIPVVTMVADSIAACLGDNVTFEVSNPLGGATYNWYDAATGGTIVHTGNDYTLNSITGPAEFYVEVVSAAGCTSATRQRVVLSNFQPLDKAVVAVTTSTATSITFAWPAVTGAVGYEVSINGGAFAAPSSGATGLEHTVSGLSGNQNICIVVRAIGNNSCQNSLSDEVCSCNTAPVTVSPDSLAVCNGATATFGIQSPISGTTYTWYDAITGGNALGTGPNFTTPAITGTTEFFVEASAGAGCSTPARTRVVVTVLPVLDVPVVTATGANATSVTFSWPAVNGAVGYEVSTDGGTTFGPVSTSTSHTVSGLSGLQQVCVIVRAVGSNSCQNSVSQSACGCNTPAVVVNPTTAEVCSGSPATLDVQSPVAGTTYNWYTQATGGTPIFTGTSFTTPAITATTEYFVEQTTTTGCTSPSRTRVEVTLMGQLAVPVPVFSTATPNSVTFTWAAVPGATGYQVSEDNGVTFGPVITATSYTFNNLTPMQQVTIVVRAVGNIACQNSISAAVSARSLGDQVFIPNTFTPNGDGVNDVLAVYGDIVRDVVFMVFNQWGEKIVESRDKNRVWDGTYKGKAQPVGVYIYATRITLLDGTVIERKGSINLVR